ncbi:hypothetical protein HU200_062921 [Digitaria exilis]|uniref:At1g61320/AtMIF1 LRR domain-containing protein n=1 Tax=Digitaria exilis TaxID=1010633 RepID=A0A835AC73_9POAL|nr:hypothetical protein HU200_062921 [Digitaria exilis]
MPLEDAARAACVSREFLRSWRRYPRLALREGTLALTDKRYREHVTESYFVNKIDHILKNRSHIVLKAFILHLYPCPNMDASYIDKWLQFALRPGIEELAFEMSSLKRRVKYNFPCSLLSVGCCKSLTSLHLCGVHITGEELGHFVSNCDALVQLVISVCNYITCFRVPGILWHLEHFNVRECQKLRVIDINAPKLSNFVCWDDLPQQISLGAAVKNITMIGSKPNMICYARAKLPFFMPTVETLTVESHCEKVKTPMMSSKFLNLKYLDIYLMDGSELYRNDHFCLVSFLDASPALETFVLRVATDDSLRPDSILRHLDGPQLHLRQMPECLHKNLKNVMISRFTSAKSLIELTRHIVQNALALEWLTLDTAGGCASRTSAKTDKCQHMCKDGLREARKAMEAVRRYIEGIVLPSTNFNVLEPCSQCECEGHNCSQCGYQEPIF